MKQSRSMMLLVALLLVGQAEGLAAKSKPAAKVASLISPAIQHGASDKKFFSKDYPNDARPVVQKAIMDKLKGPGQPYPALQSKSTFDTDYVKDENSDTGAWKAQFEYDALRKKLAQEQGEESAAEAAAKKEGADVDAAQKKADEAAKNAENSKVTDDKALADDSKDEEVLPPSAESLEKLKNQVAEAEANLEKEKKDFEKCQKELEDSKKLVEELKAKQDEMEKQLAGATKLWTETKTVRMNLKSAKEEARRTKKVAAEARLTVAMNSKAEVDKVLAREKAQSEKAQQSLQKEKAEVEQAKADLQKATLRLQKLKGYSPADQAPKSGAAVNSAFAFLAIVAVQALM